MFTVEGNLEDIKKHILRKRDELKEEKRIGKEKLRLLRAEANAIPQHRAETLHMHYAIKQHIRSLEDQVQRVQMYLYQYELPVTQFLPVELTFGIPNNGPYVYNWILLRKFSQKLKGFDYTVSCSEYGILSIHYTKGLSKGMLEVLPVAIGYTGMYPSLPQLIIQGEK